MFKITDLKQVMRRWPSGVAVITASYESKAHGMTVNSFTSVSVDPPMVTVTLANATRTKGLVDRSGYFAINLLSEGQNDISDRFAGRIAEDEDRFNGLSVKAGLASLPLLEVAAAHLECRVVYTYVMENSTLYIGEVLKAEKAQEKPPLVYFNRDYYRVKK
jgi:flavin reductase (DIM6/NTAB) family NADH-FMN oxidoreductase RutF